MSARAASLAAAVIGLAVACSGPSADDAHVIPAPALDAFPPVGDVLHSHCGSLDCHGDRARNLRLYGINGLRIGGVTGTGPTTPEEYEASYQSVVLLEPETLGRVVLEGGGDPARLTLVRKARGAEAHKGGAPMPQGSPGDRCLTSWLGQSVDTAACAEAAEIPAPEWP